MYSLSTGDTVHDIGGSTITEWPMSQLLMLFSNFKFSQICNTTKASLSCKAVIVTLKPMLDIQHIVFIDALWEVTLLAGMPCCRLFLLPREAGRDMWVNLDNGRVLCDVQRTTLTYTWRAEKWVTQPSEIQPVPFTDVEISLPHKAQRARLHYQALPQSVALYYTKLYKEWVILTTSPFNKQNYNHCFVVLNHAERIMCCVETFGAPNCIHGCVKNGFFRLLLKKGNPT